MRSDVPSPSPDESLARAADLMASLELRELAVVDGGELVGILAQRDLRPYLGHLEWTNIGAAMTRDPITVTADTSVDAVARLLVDHCFNCVPVVAKRALLGMIRRSDLLRLIFE
jgi:CBS domain-containing protein